MKGMNIQAEKLQILKWILETEDGEIISKIKEFFQTVNTTKRISLKQYNEEINEAINRLNNGEGIPHNQVMEELEDL